jgi:hypothetical protein
VQRQFKNPIFLLADQMFNGGPDDWADIDIQFENSHPNRMVHDLVQRLTDPDPHVSGYKFLQLY